jgi:hypothetical protein
MGSLLDNILVGAQRGLKAWVPDVRRPEDIVGLLVIVRANVQDSRWGC